CNNPSRRPTLSSLQNVEQQSSHGHVIGMCNYAGVCSESIYLVLLLCYLSCLYVNHMDLTMICENWQRTDTVTK
ncbi:unnamed protein product, partial [Musa hybrid cultivar]